MIWQPKPLDNRHALRNLPAGVGEGATAFISFIKRRVLLKVSSSRQKMDSSVPLSGDLLRRPMGNF